MNKMINKILFAISLFLTGTCFVLIASFLYFTYPWCNGDLPTALNIKKIKLGMSKSQVISFLGKPCSDKISDGVVGHRKGKTTITYCHFSMKNYPHLWIHFKEEVVISVYAKEYPHFGDDNAVYSLSEHTKSNFTNPMFYKIF